jgi:hypothetical protein
VIIIWFVAGVVGAIMGGMIGFVGAKYMERQSGT